MKLLALINLGGAFLGLLLAAALVCRRDTFRNASRSLGALVACGAVIIAVMVLYHTGWIQEYPSLVGVQTPLVLLIGPLFWFYVLHALRPGRGVRSYDLLHLLPFIAYVVWLWPIYTASVEVKLGPVLDAFYHDSAGYRSTQAVHAVLTLTQSGAYFVASGWLLMNDRERSHPRRRGMQLPVIGIVLLWLVMAGRFLMDLLGGWVTAESALLVPSAISVLLYAMGFHGLTRSTNWGVPTAGAYRQSSLSESQASAIANELVAVLQQQLAHLKPGFDLADLAAISGYSRNQISEALNRGRGQKFRELINELRCRYAHDQLATHPDQSLEDLAATAGFGSRSTFYAAFRRVFDESPGATKRRFLSNRAGSNKSNALID